MSDLYDKQHDAEIVRLNDRITELEASLADGNEALQVMGPKLAHAEADTQVVGDALCKTDERLSHCLTALRYYASGDHFIVNDTQLWDTVSGEPQNFWCDEAGSATVEDGRIAILTLQGNYIDWTEGGEYEPPKPLPDELDISVDSAMSHSANTVGGPTPVMDAAPACERKDNYRIVEGPSLESLEQRVNFLLRAGWTCVGSVTFSTIPYTGISVDRRPTEKYMQAMVYCSNVDTLNAGESDR